MDSLKRLYLSFASGLAYIARNKAALYKTKDDMIVSRVSREVNYYRTHFFNL